jgi:hypothetical protein
MAKSKKAFEVAPQFGNPSGRYNLIFPGGAQGFLFADDMRVTEGGALVFITGGVTTFAFSPNSYRWAVKHNKALVETTGPTGQC